MKKVFFAILLVFTTFSIAFSQISREIGEIEARQLASAFAKTQPQLSGFDLNLVVESNVFVYEIGTHGFVIVSGHTVLPPVIGWSDQGSFPDLEDAPENYASWIAHYSEMIDIAKANSIAPTAEILQQWDEATKGIFGTRNVKTVAPMVATRWNQDCYYNEYCPATSGGGWWGGPCGHVYAGCVACAMAQVMKFWDYPATGFGSHSYTHSQYGEQSANFGATTYNWAQMPNEVWSHNDAVATLMYHCGVSVNMNYSASGSGAYSRDVETAVRSYFGYCGAKYREKTAYSEEAWNTMLKAELDQGHPIYYSGANGDSGHAFVCDGYDDNDRFHFNFGWSGSGDGYYTTYDVNGFNQGQAVVMNMVPMNIQADDNGIIYVSPDGTGDGSSWENATDKLQFATALSSGGNTRVWVKKGTYYGDTTNPEGAFYISERNRIYGSFNGNEAPDFDLSLRDFEKNATILDGQGERRVLLQDDAFSSGREAIWDGFTIQNGAAGSGAGAYLNNYVTLANCVVTDNHATMYGGGLYINSTGGTVRVTIDNCSITENSSSMGGGVCDRIGATYTNCRISNNRATTKGGGIYLYNNTEPTFKNCIISNNTAKDAGGMYARGKFTAYNCDFVMNLGTESIGGVYHEERHNKYYNCILWGNVANGQPSQTDGVSDYEYCAVQGGVEGTACIDLPASNSGSEPGGYVRFQFHALGAGADYHNNSWTLQSRSICLNAGKPNTSGLGASDIYGNTRIQKGRVDIGAAESCASLTLIEGEMYESDVYWFQNRPLTQPGYYTVAIPTQDCDSVIGLTLDVLAGTDELPQAAISVWPNPTNGLLHIVADNLQAIEVRNLLGQLVMQAEKVETISLEGLEDGVYLLIISDKNGVKTSIKIIKE